MISRRISGSENGRLNFLSDWAASHALLGFVEYDHLVDRHFRWVSEIAIDETVDVMNERADAAARLPQALPRTMRTVSRQSFGKYSHERAITREEDAEVPIMELTVVDDIEPREGFPRARDTRNEADSFSARRPGPIHCCEYRIGGLG